MIFVLSAKFVFLLAFHKFSGEERVGNTVENLSYPNALRGSNSDFQSTVVSVPDATPTKMGGVFVDIEAVSGFC